MPDEGTSGRSIDVNGTVLYYEEHGHGRPLVLVHGGLGSSAMWEPLIPELTLAICPLASHVGPMTPERAPVFAGLIRDFARRHATEA